MDEVMGKLTHLQGEIDRLGAQLARENDAKEQLTKTLKVTRRLAIAALLLGVLAPLAARWLPITFRTVRAREFVVQDAEGKTRVQILVDKDAASMIVNGQDGNPAIALRSDSLSNLVYVASRSPKPSTGIRLSSDTNFTEVSLHHQEPSTEKGSLTGWIQLQSSFIDVAAISVWSANEGRVTVEGSVVGGTGPRVSVWPPKIEGSKKPASWASFGAGELGPALDFQREDGVHAGLDLSNGPQLSLAGPFGSRSDVTLAVHPYDKGGSLMLNGGETSVFATTGTFARVSAINGDQSWATPLPQPKAPEKEKK